MISLLCACVWAFSSLITKTYYCYVCAVSFAFCEVDACKTIYNWVLTLTLSPLYCCCRLSLVHVSRTWHRYVFLCWFSMTFSNDLYFFCSHSLFWSNEYDYVLSWTMYQNSLYTWQYNNIVQYNITVRHYYYMYFCMILIVITIVIMQKEKKRKYRIIFQLGTILCPSPEHCTHVLLHARHVMAGVSSLKHTKYNVNNIICNVSQ